MAMKKKRLYILSSILLLIALGGWMAFSNALFVVNSVRDIRLKAAGFEAQTFKTDSAEIHYLRGGTGKKTVLLVHGFGLGGATTWFDPMLDMENELNFIVPDLMWFGESNGQVEPNLPNQARMMWALCDQLNITPDAIAGISYGGFVAFEMLNQRPEGTKELLIINSPGPVFTNTDVDAMCARADVSVPEDLFIPKDVAALKHGFKFVFSEEPPIPDFLYEQIHANETLKNAEIKKKLMRELVENAETYRNSKLSQSVKNKVIWCANDQVFPLAYGERLADTLHAEIAVLPNSGHVPNPKMRKEFLGMIRHFLVN